MRIQRQHLRLLWLPLECVGLALRQLYRSLFLRGNKPAGLALWMGLVATSYLSGSAYSGTDTSLATAASDTVVSATPVPLAVATPIPTPTPPPTPTPEPAATPQPPTPAPAAPAAPAPARLASQVKTTATTNTYSYGYCTYYVASRRAVGPFWGNAVNWYYRAQAEGYRVGTAPAVGAIAWTSIGFGGAGHVAYVEQVAGDQIYISEMNFNGNWNRVTYRWAPASSFKYIY